MNRSELIVMAKAMGVIGLSATKKELIIDVILRKQTVAPPAPAPVPAPAPAPTEEQRVQTFMSALRRDARPYTPSEALSFDQVKLRHLFCALKPTLSTPEHRLLKVLFCSSPSVFVLNAGHTTPGGDEEPHYTLTVSANSPLNGFRIWNHYHIHYERSQTGKEIYTTVTNESREVIADFRRSSSAASVVSDQ